MYFPNCVEMEALMIHGVCGSTYPLFIGFYSFQFSTMTSRRTLKQFLTKTIKPQPVMFLLNLCFCSQIYDFSVLFRMCLMLKIDVLKYSSSRNFKWIEKTKVRRILGPNTCAHYPSLLTQTSYKFIHYAIKIFSIFPQTTN